MASDPTDPDLDRDFDTDFGGGTARIALRLGGLEVEVEGGDEDDLEAVKETYDAVLEDALERGEASSQALRDRLWGYR